MDNLEGIFTLEIDGKERELKCSFSTIEKLERQVFKRPIMAVLNDALASNISISELVDTIIVGLEGNRDTRFTREEIGEEVMKKGMVNYLEWYLSFLTYAITGNEEVEAEEVIDEDSKKN